MMHVLSGEWMLNGRNSGTKVFLRSVWVATILFTFSLVVFSLLDGDWIFRCKRGLALVEKRFEWWGAFFAGSYVVFHTRFSSQWLYLANLYNMVKQQRLQYTCIDFGAKEANAETKQMAQWMAGFISDCVELHLGRKLSFFEICTDAWQHKIVRDEIEASLDKMTKKEAAPYRRFISEMEEELPSI